jgi:hypothetical protein
MRSRGGSVGWRTVFRTAGLFVVLGAVAVCSGSTTTTTTTATAVPGMPASATDFPEAPESDSVSDFMASTATANSRPADSAKSRRDPGCKEPLTGLLHTRGEERRWVVPWNEVLAHLATLRVQADSGEKGHVMLPERPGRNRQPVRADIAPIEGTETMTEAQAMEALKCGRAIARIRSYGNHRPSQLLDGENWLIISMVNRGTNNAQWVFVVLNRRQNYRGSLETFKYTPHATGYTTPKFSAAGMMARRALNPLDKDFSKAGKEKVLSSRAKDCFSRGFKACFIDTDDTQSQGGGGMYHGLGTSGRLYFPPGVSQPWVPCPMYGCCCGGDACHED